MRHETASLCQQRIEHIGVDDEHYRPSMTWYRESRFAMSTSAPPPRNVGRGGTYAGLKAGRQAVTLILKRLDTISTA
jgi:hypothetical protein